VPDLLAGPGTEEHLSSALTLDDRGSAAPVNPISLASCFPNKIRKVTPENCRRTAQPNLSTPLHKHPLPEPLDLGTPDLLPAATLSVSPGAGVKAGRRPPVRAWP
jgi:hypothetical protein